MEKYISIREANLHLSRYVAAAEKGEEVVITRRGRPVARLVPEKARARRRLTKKQRAAHQRLMKFLNKGLDLGPKAWPGREAIYDRGRLKGWG